MMIDDDDSDHGIDGDCTTGGAWGFQGRRRSTSRDWRRDMEDIFCFEAHACFCFGLLACFPLGLMLALGV